MFTNTTDENENKYKCMKSKAMSEKARDVFIYRMLLKKIGLKESTKRDAWLSLRDTSLWGQPTLRSVMLFGVIYVLFSCMPHFFTSDTSVVHASGIAPLQATPPVAGPKLSPGMLTRKALTKMGSNDLVVGEDHMVGLSCQLYNWKTGR